MLFYLELVKTGSIRRKDRSKNWNPKLDDSFDQIEVNNSNPIDLKPEFTESKLTRTKTT